MKLSRSHLAALSLFWLLALAAEARADLIPWSYSWSASPGEIHADSGSGYVTLTADPGTFHGAGDSDIVATNLKTFSTADPSNPDTYTAKAYTLTLKLTDTTSGKSGSVTFGGLIDGTVSSGSSNLTNTFTGKTTEELVLGNTLFTTTIGPYTPPGPPDSTNLGSIAGHVTIQVSSIVPSANTPEPGTIVLALLGAAGFGAARRRRGRRRRAVQ